MTDANSLMEKLAVSKKIMEIHKELPRNSNGGGITQESIKANPVLEEFTAPTAKYNIPDELLSEQVPKAKPINIPPVPTTERIMNSKLPDDIKKLMLEHPIQQPQAPVMTISNELVEKATRLMGTAKKEEKPIEKKKPQSTRIVESETTNNDLRSLLKEVLNELLIENGIISESTTKTNETIQFKVGKTIFE